MQNNLKLCIAVYADDENSFLVKKTQLLSLGLSTEQIIWSPSRTENRLNVIKAYANQWLLFLDYDCELQTEALKYIYKISSQSDVNKTIFIGFYQNPVRATYLQKVHNFVANNWVRQSFRLDFANKHILGGIFLVSPFNDTILPSAQETPLFWGAEDLWLSQVMTDAGFKIVFSEQLKVIHHTAYSWAHFIRRAWLQGRNHQRYIRTQKSDVSRRAKYSFWSQSIVRSGILLTPAILIHFCIQKSALLFQKIRPMHK